MKSINFKSPNDVRTFIKDHPDEGMVLHVPIDMIESLSKGLPSHIVLCSTSGEYSSQGYHNGVITGFTYPKEMAQIIALSTPALKSLKSLKLGYDKVSNNPNAFLLLLLDGLSGTEESIMSTLFFMRSDFKVIGGSAGDNLKFQETAVYRGETKIHNVAIFFDNKRKAQLIKENLYTPYGDKLLITDADPVKRVVISINGRPAATEYARVLGIPESQLADNFMNNPLGKIYKDEVLIASPMKVNPDKTITFYCQVMPNTFVYLLKPEDPIQKLKETLSDITFKPSFMYVINCILRSLKFQNDHIWKDFDHTLLSKCHNTTGFISYGEQFYGHHVNQTMVILAIE